jgi:hypothetical protein
MNEQIRWIFCIAVIGLQPWLSTSAFATSVCPGFAFGHSGEGTELHVDLVPELPKRGEAFVLRVTGTANRRCPPTNAFYDAAFSGPNHLALRLPLGNESGFCEIVFPNAFSFDVPVDAEAWSLIDPAEPLRVTMNHTTGINALGCWERSFDMRFGLHTVPPRLHSGFWLSESRPNEGLLVQQQADIVVVYDLRYTVNEEDTRSADGNLVGRWLYSNATFDGNSGNGVGIKISRPVAGMPEVELEEYRSSSVVVEGFNRIQAAPWIPMAPEPFETTSYRPWQFRRSEAELPVTIPDMTGDWRLMSVEGDTLVEAATPQLGDWQSIDANEVVFPLVSGDGEALCTVDDDGEGGCFLEVEALGSTFRFDLADFNGNVATGFFEAEGPSVPTEGILIRDKYELP